MRDDGERLRDILEAISRIERHTIRGRATFEQDETHANVGGSSFANHRLQQLPEP